MPTKFYYYQSMYWSGAVMAQKTFKSTFSEKLQTGVFFQYDGRTLYASKCNSIQDILSHLPLQQKILTRMFNYDHVKKVEDKYNITTIRKQLFEKFTLSTNYQTDNLKNVHTVDFLSAKRTKFTLHEFCSYPCNRGCTF